MSTILIIEDEEPIRELIKMNLSMAGYDSLEASDGEEGLQLINTEQIDLIILDIMLPKFDGFDLLPTIVKKDIPTIILTAKDRLQDKIKGLEMGADDYITKPFETIELLARVKSVLRRAGKEKTKVVIDDLEIFLDQRKVLRNGKEIELTYKEFDLLRILIENKGCVLSRERLLEVVWGYDFEGNTRTVDTHIQRLRSKLGIDKIKTVYKVGYRLED